MFHFKYVLSFHNTGTEGVTDPDSECLDETTVIGVVVALCVLTILVTVILSLLTCLRAKTTWGRELKDKSSPSATNL